MTDAETIARLRAHIEHVEDAAKSARELPGGWYWSTLLWQGAAWLRGMMETMR